MNQIANKPSHSLSTFDEYIPYSGPEGEGFILVQNSEFEEVYIFDDYGGWVDMNLNYYDKDGQPAGFFDKDHNFYDMKGRRIPGGYKGNREVEKRLLEIRRYIEKVVGHEKTKFVVEFSNLPISTRPEQIAAFIYDRCSLVPEALEECKKNSKEQKKGFVVVRGSAIVNKIIALEGRKFRIKEKDGSYTSSRIEIFVKLSKQNNPIQKENNSIITAPLEEDDLSQSGFKIMFEGLDINKSDQEFKDWLERSADSKNAQINLSRQKTSGIIELQNEDLKFLLTFSNILQVPDTQNEWKEIRRRNLIIQGLKMNRTRLIQRKQERNIPIRKRKIKMKLQIHNFIYNIKYQTKQSVS